MDLNGNKWLMIKKLIIECIKHINNFTLKIL